MGRDFVESGCLRGYITGTISREKANAALHKSFADPVAVYEGWMERYNYGNPLEDVKRSMARHLADMRVKIACTIERAQTERTRLRDLEEEIRRLIQDARAGKTQLHQLLSEIKALKLTNAQLIERPVTLQLMGELTSAPRLSGDISQIVSCAVNAIASGQLKFEDSVSLDMFHSCYLPIADLWRTDRRFANALSVRQAPYRERIVNSLAELPERIDDLQAQIRKRA